MEQEKNIVRQMLAEETGWEFPRLLDEMCDASDFYFDDVSQIRMHHWSNGWVLLVGDAACGPTLISGQGHEHGDRASLCAGWGTGVGGRRRHSPVTSGSAAAMEQNRQIAQKAKGLRIPATGEAVEQQNQLLRAMRAAPPRLTPGGFDRRHHSEGG